MSLVENEQAKLTATYLNGLAIATFAVGGLAPVVALASGATAAGSSEVAIGLTTICLVLSAILHLTARRHLRRLKP